MAPMTMTAMKTATKRTSKENDVLCSSRSPMKCSGDPSPLPFLPKRLHPRTKRTPRSRPPKPPPRLPHQQSLPPAATNSRIDLHELKSDIVIRVGADRSNCYFSHLNLFLAHKILKTEFLRLCISTLGRENIPLHNHLIRSILHNVYRAKGPGPGDQGKPAEISNATGNGGSETQMQLQNTSSNGAISRCNVSIEASPPHVNGVSAVPSSPLLPNEENALYCKTILLPYLNTHVERASKPESENGQAIAQHNDEEIGHEQTTKRARAEDEDIAREVSCVESVAIAFTMDHEQPVEREKIQDASVEVIAVEDEEDMKYTIDLNSLGIIQPPLGVPLCSASARMQQQGDSVTRHRPSRCHGRTVKKRVQEIVKEQGLKRVTEDCINVINGGLEAYLKKLIRSSLELTGGGQSSKEPICPTGKNVVSFGDFKLAIELNTQKLGENWPTLLEKSFSSSVN